MKIIGYGRLTDILEGNSFSHEGVANTDQLQQKLIAHYPSLSGIPYAIAVNNKIISENCPLQQDDTVSLLPPFSGG